MEKLVREQRLWRLVQITWVAFLCGVTGYFFTGSASEQPDHRAYAQSMVLSRGMSSVPLFSPDDKIRDVIIGFIQAENKKILLASYVVTDKKIAEALIEAKQRGVVIEVITCRSGAQDQWSKVEMLIQAKIPVYVYPEAFIRSLMHNKFIVFYRTFDRMMMATGSYNMTRSASDVNQENFIFMQDEKVIKLYIARFDVIKKQSVRVKTAADYRNRCGEV